MDSSSLPDETRENDNPTPQSKMKEKTSTRKRKEASSKTKEPKEKKTRSAEEERNYNDESDGILSNEDFRKIKELKAKKEAKIAVARKGFKVPDSDQLSKKRVNPAKLEAHIRHKLTKEQRLELVKAGREDRGKYQSKTAIKHSKKSETGGTSNKQKENKKNMPLAAIRSKARNSRRAKKMKDSRSGKQFKGKKARK